MTDLGQILQLYWLTDKESALYLALLPLGSSPISTIAKLAWLPRPTAYHCVESMIDKWVVTTIKRQNVLHCTAVLPELLYDKFQERLMVFKDSLPLFASLSWAKGAPIKMRFFEWLDEVKTLYYDQLTSSTGIRSFLGTTNISSVLMDFFRQVFLPLRVEREIVARKILTNTPQAQLFSSRDHEEYRQSLLIDSLNLWDGNEIAIYWPNKVGIALFHTTKPTGVIIENEQLYQTLSGLFELLWSTHHSVQNMDNIKSL